MHQNNNGIPGQIIETKVDVQSREGKKHMNPLDKIQLESELRNMFILVALYALIAFGLLVYWLQPLGGLKQGGTINMWIWALAWSFAGLSLSFVKAIINKRTKQVFYKDRKIRIFYQNYVFLYPLHTLIIGTLAFIVSAALLHTDTIPKDLYWYASATLGFTLSLSIYWVVNNLLKNVLGRGSE